MFFLTNLLIVTKYSYLKWQWLFSLLRIFFLFPISPIGLFTVYEQGVVVAVIVW